jgi:hypothetical protein
LGKSAIKENTQASKGSLEVVSYAQQADVSQEAQQKQISSSSVFVRVNSEKKYLFGRGKFQGCSLRSDHWRAKPGDLERANEVRNKR